MAEQPTLAGRCAYLLEMVEMLVEVGPERLERLVRAGHREIRLLLALLLAEELGVAAVQQLLVLVRGAVVARVPRRALPP